MLMEEEQIDRSKLRYVLYARKSTEDETRQIKSIEDQIAECESFARRLEPRLNVVEVLQESKSAKRPNNRPIFREMLDGIRKGKYDGILAWHPDRLSRNMLEGGEIIDMIDEGIIKDLQFVTHHFSSDANGKMLLGMAFVLSKQYSDKLSTDVKRGLRGRFRKEGKSSIPKHGYINEGGIYSPDDEPNEKGYSNYGLIREAWQMRLRVDSQEKIADYMNINGYGRKVKKDGRRVKITNKRLSEVFQDPFYYGILIQVTQTVDLREMYDFEPAITEDEYNQVQQLTRRRQTPYNLRRNVIPYPFRGIIRCEYCKHNMVIGPSSGHTKRYLYARCDYEDCIRNSKENRDKSKNDKTKIKISVRMSIVMDFLKDFFSKFKLTDGDYKRYYDRLDKLSGERRIRLQTEIRSLNGSLTKVNQEIDDIAFATRKLSGVTLERNQKRAEELNLEKIDLESKIAELKGKLTNPEQDRLTLEQFLNLIEKAETIVKSADEVKKDVIVRKVFLNLDIDDTKVASYRLNPPFDTMKNTREFSSSRGERN